MRPEASNETRLDTLARTIALELQDFEVSDLAVWLTRFAGLPRPDDDASIEACEREQFIAMFDAGTMEGQEDDLFNIFIGDGDCDSRFFRSEDEAYAEFCKPVIYNSIRQRLCNAVPKV